MELRYYEPISMLAFPHRFFLCVKANVQVCASAEHLPSSFKDYASNAIVHVEHAKDADKLLLHDFGKSIVVFWTIEGHEYDGGGSG
jgi:hypothetical protein